MKFAFSSSLLLAVLLLNACSSPSAGTEPVASAAEPFPVVQDTLQPASQPRTASWLSTTEHRFFYIGPYQDTIVPNHALTSFPAPPVVNTAAKGYSSAQSNALQAFAVDPERHFREWPMAEHAKVHITIDTTQRISVEQPYGGESPLDTLSRWYDSYPVMLRNNQKDTIVIGTGDYVFLHLEAKDAQGQWRRIERPLVYMCGNGLLAVFLPPQQVVLSSVFIPHGEFTTELRLQLGRNYSSAFKGKINVQQFESRYE